MPGLTHAADTPRRMSSLDGIWQIAEGGMDQAPASFECTVPVLGLVNMARPVFVEPGPKMGNREQIPHKDSRRDAVTAAAAWGFDFEIIDLSLYPPCPFILLEPGFDLFEQRPASAPCKVVRRPPSPAVSPADFFDKSLNARAKRERIDPPFTLFWAFLFQGFSKAIVSVQNLLRPGRREPPAQKRRPKEPNN